MASGQLARGPYSPPWRIQAAHERFILGRGGAQTDSYAVSLPAEKRLGAFRNAVQDRARLSVSVRRTPPPPGAERRLIVCGHDDVIGGEIRLLAARSGWLRAARARACPTVPIWRGYCIVRTP